MVVGVVVGRRRRGRRGRLLWLRCRRRRRLLRPHPDHPHLAAIGRVPDVVVQELPARRVDRPVDARRERRGPRFLHHLVALQEVAVGNPLHRSRPGHLERRGHRDDLPVLRRAVEIDRQRVGAHEREQEQPVWRVVHELEIGVRIVHRRVPSLWVVADVEGMVRPRGDVEAALVGGVEGGRRDLADAAAEAGPELSVDDDRRLQEALRRIPVARRAVEREGRPRADQGVVDQVRDELHVVDPVRVTAEYRRVAAHDTGDPHRLRLGGRAARRRCHDRDGSDAVPPAYERREQSLLGLGAVELETVARGRHAYMA